MPDTHAVPLEVRCPRVRSLGSIESVQGRGCLGRGSRGLRGGDAEDGGAQGQPGLVGSFFRTALTAYRDFGILDERLGYYASLQPERGRGRRRLERPLRALHGCRDQGAGGLGLVRARDPGPARSLRRNAASSDPRLRRVRGLPPPAPADEATRPGREGGAAPRATGRVGGRGPRRLLGPHERRRRFRRGRYARGPEAATAIELPELHAQPRP